MWVIMREKKKKFLRNIIGIVLVLTLMLCTGCGVDKSTDEAGDNSQTEQTENVSDVENELSQESQNAENEGNQKEAATEEAEKYQFPVLLDDGKVELSSVFEYSGINPDCGDELAEDIGAVQMKNISGEYLKTLQIKVTMSDGTELDFLVEDVPPETEVLAFELQNKVYDKNLKIMNLQAEGEYSAEVADEEYSYEVSGSDIAVTNLSEEAKTEVAVSYHCTIDGMIFGGQSYELPIETLEPGETFTVTDTFCLLGDVTVVSIN